MVPYKSQAVVCRLALVVFFSVKTLFDDTLFFATLNLDISETANRSKKRTIFQEIFTPHMSAFKVMRRVRCIVKVEYICVPDTGM
jgi:hypothetical protein